MNNQKSMILMKRFLYIIIWLMFSLNLAFADGWILWNFKWDSATTEKALRTWDIHTDDVPNILKWAIDFMMTIAWTIAIIFIIIWAYKILFGSIEWNGASEWKKTIIMAISWFAIASLAWFIIKFIIDNFS